MTLRVSLIALSFFACAAQRPAPAPTPPPVPIVIVNVNVLPMSSANVRVLSGQTVIISGDRIVKIGAAGDVRAPRGAQVIDGTGKYLIPGLVDTHVHLHGNPENEQIELLKLFLAQGVTTMLVMRGTPQILALTSRVNAGEVRGPRMYTVGPYVNEPFVTTPDQVDSAVTAERRAGYDFVKLHGDLSREAYARLISTGRREGVRIIGHAPRNLGVEVMFAEGGQYALAHMEEFLYDRTNSSRDSSLPTVRARIPEFARETKRTGMFVMTTLTAYKAIALMVHDLSAVLARPEMRCLPQSNQTGWGPATNPYTNRIDPSRYEPMMARYHLLEEMVRQFHAAGVPLLLGTDAMNTGTVAGFSAHDELADLVTAGLTPYEALRAATANAGAFFGDPASSHTIVEGQPADLVLLDANPLEAIGNTRRIAGVMVRGKWLQRQECAAT